MAKNTNIALWYWLTDHLIIKCVLHSCVGVVIDYRNPEWHSYSILIGSSWAHTTQHGVQKFQHYKHKLLQVLGNKGQSFHACENSPASCLMVSKVSSARADPVCLWIILKFKLKLLTIKMKNKSSSGSYTSTKAENCFHELSCWIQLGSWYYLENI